MPSYWPIKNTLVQILHCFACDTVDTVQHTWNENHDWRITCFFFLFEAFNPCQINVAQKKNTNKNDVFLVGKHAQQTNLLIETPFFLSVFGPNTANISHRKSQKSPSPNAPKPPPASCSIHGSKCAGSRYRIELRQLVDLKVGVSSRSLHMELVAPTKWPKITWFFFTPI